MRTVNLIQFPEGYFPAYGYIPDPMKLYEVTDMNSDYTYEQGEDEDYEEITIEAIRVAIPIRVGRKESRKITQIDNANYNLLTIVLDDDSKLFR